MDCRGQVSLEFLVYLIAFLSFIFVLMSSQTEMRENLKDSKFEGFEKKCVFGKFRCGESNFTRWFR